MEVVQFISSNDSLFIAFSSFLKSYKKLYLSDQDQDTLFYQRVGSNKHEIYFHNYFDDIDKEFEYNFSEEELRTVREFFKHQKIYLFSIQYRNGKFLEEMLDDFKIYLNELNMDIIPILVAGHPTKGIIKLN
jgi:hypothetical protein